MYEKHRSLLWDEFSIAETWTMTADLWTPHEAERGHTKCTVQPRAPYVTSPLPMPIRHTSEAEIACAELHDEGSARVVMHGTGAHMADGSYSSATAPITPDIQRNA